MTRKKKLQKEPVVQRLIDRILLQECIAVLVWFQASDAKTVAGVPLKQFNDNVSDPLLSKMMDKLDEMS